MPFDVFAAVSQHGIDGENDYGTALSGGVAEWFLIVDPSGTTHFPLDHTTTSGYSDLALDSHSLLCVTPEPASSGLALAGLFLIVSAGARRRRASVD